MLLRTTKKTLFPLLLEDTEEPDFQPMCFWPGGFQPPTRMQSIRRIKREKRENESPSNKIGREDKFSWALIFPLFSLNSLGQKPSNLP